MLLIIKRGFSVHFLQRTEVKYIGVFLYTVLDLESCDLGGEIPILFSGF